MVFIGSLANKRTWHYPKEANSGSLQLYIWQFDNAPCLLWANGWDPSYLNQGLKFTQRRRDYPLPPPINRGGSHGLREEKIGSKVSQKTSLPPSLCCRFSSSFFLRHRKLAPSPFLPPAPPWATSTTKLYQDHRPATTTSVISHRERLSLICKMFLLPSLSTVSSAPEDPADTFLLHQQTAVQPPCEPKSTLVEE